MNKKVLLDLVRRYARGSGGGGYSTVLYLRNEEPLCPYCAKENYKQISVDTKAGWGEFEALTVGDFLEGPSVFCRECGTEIESTYGDPDAESA